MIKQFLLKKAINLAVKNVIKDKRNLSDDVVERKKYALEHGGFWWGSSSWKKLKTCHPQIQEWMIEAIKHMNLTIICGERGEVEQRKAVTSGASTVPYPKSKHNKPNPFNVGSDGVKAIDVAPFPVDWLDLERFCYVGGKIMLLADMLKIDIRWGGDWDKNGRMRDDEERGALRDYVHFEMAE